LPTRKPLRATARTANNAGMNEPAEDGDKTADVVDRLALRFPTLPRDHVAEVVQQERDRLDGARVRDFIPLLVEHEATERLRLEAEPQLTVTDGVEGVGANVDSPTLDPVELQRRAEPPSGPLLGNYGGR
jgi:hypothetical protein